MVEKDKFLVVVSVLEGRKFPRRPRCKLLTEARFDGELLATDPVEHVENPDFTQELAWELDKKGLHQYRLQRTSIKVQVYAVDQQSTVREAVGYVVLDLRSAQNQQTNKWYTLLHSKYSKSKPEIRLGIYIDDDKGEEHQGFKAREAPARPGIDPSLPMYYDPKQLKPELHDTEGYYQIGPINKCTDSFVLSVTVAFAANLPQLIPTTVPLPPTGFFFYYTLFGNDVTNEAFSNILNPAFPPERASVRIRSSVEALQQFFASLPGLEIHLCCGDQSLGSADVPLKDLLRLDSMEIYMKPVTVEGAFQLHPPTRIKQQLPTVPDDQRPLVGVSVVLRKEDQASPKAAKQSPQAQASQPEQVKLPSPKPSPEVQQATPTKKSKGKDKKKRRPQTPPPPSPPPPHDGSYTETFESTSRTDNNIASLGEEVRKVAQNAADDKQVPVHDDVPAPPQDQSPVTSHPQQHKTQHKVLTQGQATQQLNYPLRTQQTSQQSDDASNATSAPHVVIPPQAHHYSFAIDLRSISSLQVAHHANVFLRYTYPFFGSAAPILTHPAVEVRRGTEVLLPQSYCAFDFATTPQQLQDTFTRVPLFVEVWDRDKDKSQSVLLGAAQVLLSAVCDSERARAVHASGMTGWRQVWSHKLGVQAADGQSEREIAELQVVLTLEDWGPITQKVTVGNDSSQAYSVSEPSQTRPAPAPEPPAPPPPDPRETLEYRAAMELEMWKEQQEGVFENQLKDKEAQYMRVLAEEWKRRDKEREMVVKKKLSEYNQLEQQLRKTLSDLEKREKQLAANEQDVLRLRTDLQREHERKLTEMREASRRLKEDSDHQIQLEKNKTRDLEDMITKLKASVSEAEAKYQRLDKEFTMYKDQQNSKPEVRLQSEINLLTLEKAELERKLDAVTKSKIHYKQQWGRALKELARLKQKEQTAARAQLQRQQQELEHMRLRYLAAEEKEVVQTEKKQLEEIKNQLNQLREQETQRSEASNKMSESLPYAGGPGDLNTTAAPEDEEHITRLIEERDTLLRTGVYTTDDRIISELDRQIREAIANRGR